jgi:hypothetical protein
VSPATDAVRRPPGRQLSLLAGDVAPPGVADLEGLLCGTGHVVRGIGPNADAARISVLVDDSWRVAALEEQLDALDLLEPRRPAPTPARPDAVSVRTRFDARLLPVYRRWILGATPVVPAPLHLDGHRLWWWAVSAGSVETGGRAPRGFRLRLAPSAPRRWSAAGAALAELGVPGIFLGPRADGPAYRLVGSRRLARLADLLGEPPAEAPAGMWPVGEATPGLLRIGKVRHQPPASTATPTSSPGPTPSAGSDDSQRHDPHRR